MAFIAMAPASAQQSRTLKSEMETIHELLGINFVYDSSMDLSDILICLTMGIVQTLDSLI
jgi:hypothetical protein